MGASRLLPSAVIMSLINVVRERRYSNAQGGCAEMRSPMRVLVKALTIQNDTLNPENDNMKHKIILCGKVQHCAVHCVTTNQGKC